MTKKRGKVEASWQPVAAGAAVVAVFGIYGAVIAYCFESTKSGPWGDSFGPLTGLVTALAFCVAVYSVRQQGKELALQRRELRLQRKQLKLQRDDLKQSIEALQDQAAQAKEQVALNRALLNQQKKAHGLAIRAQKLEEIKLNVAIADLVESGTRDPLFGGRGRQYAQELQALSPLPIEDE